MNQSINIFVLNWNGMGVLNECLSSLNKISYNPILKISTKIEIIFIPKIDISCAISLKRICVFPSLYGNILGKLCSINMYKKIMQRYLPYKLLIFLIRILVNTKTNMKNIDS